MKPVINPEHNIQTSRFYTIKYLLMNVNLNSIYFQYQIHGEIWVRYLNTSNYFLPSTNAEMSCTVHEYITKVHFMNMLINCDYELTSEC